MSIGHSAHSTLKGLHDDFRHLLQLENQAVIKLLVLLVVVWVVESLSAELFLDSVQV